MGWSDEAFKTRVGARAGELGKSVRQVLTAAGMAADTLEKIPSAGRRIDTLEKIGGALGWSLAQVLGLEPLPIRVTAELYRLATETARRGLRYVPHNDQVFAEIAARIMNILADRQRDGLPIDDQAYLTGLADYVASEWQKNS
jgi:hypothetical protein